MNVSAVMPTRSRQRMAQESLDCFLNQSYPQKELVVLDDSEDPSFPEGIQNPLVRYFTVPGRLSIAAKRNRVNELAAGQILIHWDSDDISAPERMRHQVQFLLDSGKGVAGFHSMVFMDETGQMKAYGAAHRYGAGLPYAVGTSLIYMRSFWAANRFKETLRFPWGEDNHFVYAARAAEQLVSVDAERMMLARVHRDSTSQNRMDRWAAVPDEERAYWRERMTEMFGVNA